MMKRLYELFDKLNGTAISIINEANQFDDEYNQTLAVEIYDRVITLINKKSVAYSDGQYIAIERQRLSGEEDLSVLFVHPSHPMAKPNVEYTIRTTKGTPMEKVIVCAILPTPPTKNNVVQLLSHLPKHINREALIHEIIHYLDTKRFKGGDDAVRDAMKKQTSLNLNNYHDSSDMETYFNNPMESNAYFQQTSEKITSQIRNNPDYREKYLMKGFKEFERLFRSELDHRFLMMIKPENNQKLTKRIYSTYTALLNEYKNN